MSKPWQHLLPQTHNPERCGYEQTLTTSVTSNTLSREVWLWANPDNMLPQTHNPERCDWAKPDNVCYLKCTILTGVTLTLKKAWQCPLPQTHNPERCERSISSWWSGHSRPPCTPGVWFAGPVSCAQGHHRGHRWSSQTASSSPSFFGCHWKKFQHFKITSSVVWKMTESIKKILKCAQLIQSLCLSQCYITHF